MAREQDRSSGLNNPSKAARWRAIIAEQASSGLSQKAYCRQKRLKAGTFAWWKHRLSEPGSRGGHSRFVPIRLRAAGKMRPTTDRTLEVGPASPPSPGHAAVEIVSGELLVRVYSDCAEAMLARLITVLRGEAC